MMRPINPSVHPGEILREQFLVPLGMSASVSMCRAPAPSVL
jgi:plasmid maintenance system antidote protein VapI